MTISNQIVSLHNHSGGIRQNFGFKSFIYFHLFHTAEVGQAVKDENCNVEVEGYIAKELFRRLEHHFLNFYMSPNCKRLGEIREYPLTTYGAMRLKGNQVERKKEI